MKKYLSVMSFAFIALCLSGCSSILPTSESPSTNSTSGSNASTDSISVDSGSSSLDSSSNTSDSSSSDPVSVLGTTLSLGDYPQTVVEDATLLTALGNITEVNSRGYLDYNSNEYLKVTAAPYGSGYKSISGLTTFINGNTYYFKVEPIEWTVLSGVGTQSGLVVSKYILGNSYFYTSASERTLDGSTIYPNNYQYSTLRAFLNNYNGESYGVTDYSSSGFLNKAFTTSEQSLIQTTTVNNSASSTDSNSNPYVCANTDDKIFALSYQEANNTAYFADATARKKVVSDYARATGAYCSSSTGCGCWLLRSPHSNIEYSNGSWSISGDGNIYGGIVNGSDGAFVPSFNIKIS